ncbi:CHAT domain-containing protein [Symbioplanes lichenis]|uniref:CHAT domain-containing protein n=1 Tax=Symbioplanes lichenis TaxID=1629072 RepID=UPI0027393512|nr:CHAT domain-containing protein [Actinoplanes lichenis]
MGTDGPSGPGPSGVETGTGLRDEADAAFTRVVRDPARYAAGAEALVTTATAAGDHEALVVALRAVAWTRHVALDNEGAKSLLDRAVTLAARHELPRRLGEVLLTRSVALQELGREAAAARDLRRAEPLVAPGDRPELLLQLAVIDHNGGRLTTAEATYQAVLADPATPPFVWVKAANNLALLQTVVGRPHEALANLDRAAELAREMGSRLPAVIATSAAWASYHAGRLAESVRRFEEAGRLHTAAGLPVGEHLQEYADVLRDLRLLDEAMTAAREAHVELDKHGARLMAADARLRCARLALELGDAAAALADARAAAVEFRRQRRRAWVARAAVTEAEARACLDGNSPGVLTQLCRAAATLERLGLREEAAYAHLAAGRSALALGRLPMARRELTAVGDLAEGQSLLVRLRGHLARALLAEAEAPGEVVRACLRGLRDLARHRSALPSLELRVLASGHGAELGQLGLRTLLSGAGGPARQTSAANAPAGSARQTGAANTPAVSARQAGAANISVESARQAGAANTPAGSARQTGVATIAALSARQESSPNTPAASVLAWLERTRSAALLRVHPPATGVDEDVVALRGVERELREARLDRGEEPAALLARQSALESRIRRRSWSQDEGIGAAAATPVGAAELRRALDGRWLAEYAVLGDRVIAVVVEPRRTRLVELGDVAAVRRESGAAEFALRRLLLGTRFAAPARHAAQNAVAGLTKLLVAPIGVPGDVPLVVVPSTRLSGVPWSALHSAPVSVSPSAGLWAHARAAVPPCGERGERGENVGPDRDARPAQASGSGGVAVVAGPDLAGAAGEVKAVAAEHDDVRVLLPPHSTAGAAIELARGADLAHFACHGRFRSDSPLFSSLELSDGPLTLYEMLAQGVAPRRVVLASCQSGAHQAYGGDEVLGFAGAMMSHGSAGVVAADLPIPDGACAAAMAVLHRHLAGGAGLPEAVWHARAAVAGGGAEEYVAWYGLTAYGPG